MDETIGLMHENGFAKFGENMKSMLHDQDASARSDAGIIVMSMFFAGLLIVAFTTNPVASGTQIGERAPIFSGEAYDGNSWSSFDFEDLLCNFSKVSLICFCTSSSEGSTFRF